MRTVYDSVGLLFNGKERLTKHSRRPSNGIEALSNIQKWLEEIKDLRQSGSRSDRR
jgi:hypothetical protein